MSTSAEMELINELCNYAHNKITKNIGSATREIKNSIDLVTDIDRDIETYCITRIRSSFPSDDIISEEYFNQKALPKKGRYWIIDPLDGTWNFCAGIPLCAFQIALVCDNSVLLSAIDIAYPTCGREVYIAEAGKGAFLNGHRLRVKDVQNTKQSIVAVSDVSLWDSSLVSLELKMIEKLRPAVGVFRLFGSSAITFSYLASSRVNAYVAFNQKNWDILPGLLIATEAGCEALNFDGSPYTIGRQNFLLTANASLLSEKILKSLSA